jgi:hypothetical protein
MRMVQDKSKKEGARKNIDLLTYEDVQINEISKEFFPKPLYRKGKGHLCPLCCRSHYHKRPGPFTYGLTVRRSEDIVSVWARASGCCGWEQQFPLEKIKRRKIKELDFIPTLARIFYPNAH